jgi:hypothetical protein
MKPIIPGAKTGPIQFLKSGRSNLAAATPPPRSSSQEATTPLGLGPCVRGSSNPCLRLPCPVREGAPRTEPGTSRSARLAPRPRTLAPTRRPSATRGVASCLGQHSFILGQHSFIQGPGEFHSASSGCSPAPCQHPCARRTQQRGRGSWAASRKS